MLIYTWSVGSIHCEDDIHPHNDPHDHLYDESEWTHQAVAYPLQLAGKSTVRITSMMTTGMINLSGHIDQAVDYPLQL